MVVSYRKNRSWQKERTCGSIGWVLNDLVTSFEASTNLTFESECLHFLFLNNDQSVRNENNNFNVNRLWDLETIKIGIR